MDKHNIRDIIGKSEGEAPVLGMVIKDIFMSCDADNEGLVPVSKLVDFIMPFLQGNTHALDELQKSLDPNNVNPSIDIDTFYKDMNAWTLKISSAEHVEEEDLNITPRDFDRLTDKDMRFVQSTPRSRSSFGHHLLKGYVESGISNLSIASSANESVMLEEQVQQLQHQNRQMTEEMARVKAELTAVAEHNEILQSDLDQVQKKLANEHKLNAQLQSDERKTEDDCEEELCCTRKQVVKLERTVATLEKQNDQLQRELDTVITEKQGLEYQIQRMDRRSEETKSNMALLQREIDMKKSEVDSERKTNEALAQHNQELCDIIEKCVIEIDRLKVEKAMMRKFIRDKLNKGESLRGINLSRPCRSNSFSEFAGHARKTTDRRRVSDFTAAANVPELKPKPFNSPKLLRMLKEPVTPTIDGAAFRSPHKRSDVNLAAMILNRSNNPYYKDQRSLLDLSPPVELNKIPVLDPRVLPSDADSVGVEILENIFDRAMRAVNETGSNFGDLATPSSNTESPPVLNVLRSPTTVPCAFSPKMNDSCDDYFFYDYGIVAAAVNETSSPNLLDEMAKATVCGGIEEESECEESASESKDHFGAYTKSYISEIHLKLDEYIDLEQKCEALEQTIAELQSESFVKDAKITDLNREIDKLRRGTDDDDKRRDRVDALLRTIEELEREKERYEIERHALIREIDLLNEEKAMLQASKVELLSKIGEIQRRSIETEPVKSVSEDLECLKIDYDVVKSSMETYQKLNENLNAKNRLLQRTMHEKERILDDSLDEIAQLRNQAEDLKEEIHKFHAQLEDSKRTMIVSEREVSRRESELEKIESKLAKNERALEENTATLKSCQVQRDYLSAVVEDLRQQFREKCEHLTEVTESNECLRAQLNQTVADLEQETRKQNYLYKKFISLENELIDEKNSSKRFRIECDSLQKDIERFKEAMANLEEQSANAENTNSLLSARNAELAKSYEEKAKETAALADAKSFIAGKNEELLRENAEICRRYDVVAKELKNKTAILEDMKRKLNEIEQLRAENRRIKIESEEIVAKMNALDNSEDTESDQMAKRPSSRIEKRSARKSGNFDRLTLRNTRLEEKVSALSDEVAELRDRLAKEIESKEAVISHINTIRDILFERRIRLGRATESTVDVWKTTLEDHIGKSLFDEDLMPESPILALTEPLDEEMWRLKHQIHTTTVLLSHLTCFINRQMLKKDEFTQTDPEHYLSLHRVGDVSTTRMEETFATLVLTYTVDKDLLQRRFHNKKIQLGEAERLLGEAVASLSLYLDENCSGLNVSHYTNGIVQLCTQVSVAAVQYGSLRQQTELTAAAEMMVNYVANLKQEIEMLTQMSSAMEPTTSLDPLEDQSPERTEECSATVADDKTARKRKFASCANMPCVVLTLSIFVLVVSLVLNVRVVFNTDSHPPI